MKNQRQKFIKLEGRTYEDYSYPDLLVPLEKTNIEIDWQWPSIEERHNQGKPTPTFEDQRKIWEDKLHDLSQQGKYVLTIRQFVDFLSLLRSGKAYDKNGKKVDSRIIQKQIHRVLNLGSRGEFDCDKNRYSEILENIFSVEKSELPEEPMSYRTEFYLGRPIILPNDAKKVCSMGQMHYHQITTNGSLEKKSVSLDSIRIKGDYFFDEDSREFAPRPNDINFYSWLETADKYGLPTISTKKGKMHYHFPSFGGVSAFVAQRDFDETELALHCNGAFWNINEVGARLARLG